MVKSPGRNAACLGREHWGSPRSGSAACHRMSGRKEGEISWDCHLIETEAAPSEVKGRLRGGVRSGD